MRTTMVTIAAATGLLFAGSAGAHCQIPCGIYGDMMRMDMMFEDVTTIEKSMSSIGALAGTTSAADLNQLVRWIDNKDVHADKIADVMTAYFLQQRIKPAAIGDEAAEKRYTKQLVLAHAILLTSMKAKQTVDASIASYLRDLIEQFKKVYFTEEELAHAAEHGH